MQAMTRWALAAAAAATLIFVGRRQQPRGLRANRRLPTGASVVAVRRERHLGAVSDDWRGTRDRWIATVQGSSSPEVLATQLMALEKAMGWDSVEEVWRQRRAGWVSSMQAARTAGDVARGLLELEENTLWSAVAEDWRGLRDSWIARVKSIR